MSSKYAVPFLREYMYFVLCILFLTFTFLGILNNGEVCFLCFIVFQLQSQKKKNNIVTSLKSRRKFYFVFFCSLDPFLFLFYIENITRPLTIFWHIDLNAHDSRNCHSIERSETSRRQHQWKLKEFYYRQWSIQVIYFNHNLMYRLLILWTCNE